MVSPPPPPPFFISFITTFSIVAPLPHWPWFFVSCRWAAMALLQRQMTRPCRQQEMHRTLSSSSSSSKRLMHGRSLKEFSLGKNLFFFVKDIETCLHAQQSDYWIRLEIFDLQTFFLLTLEMQSWENFVFFGFYLEKTVGCIGLGALCCY